MLSILIVDDEVSVVDSLEMLIPWADMGIGVVHKAHSGVEALEILELHPVDIVITDIRMPEMSGLELIEQIGARWKKIVCVLLTGHADFAYARQAIENHVAEYLLKPISDEEIVEKISHIAEQIRQNNEEKEAYHRAMQTMREHLPTLRADLLNDLLQGRRISASALCKKMEALEIPIAAGDEIAVMLVRLDEGKGEQDFYQLSLFQYAVGNMAEEIFGDRFTLWHGKDIHQYLVFLVVNRSHHDVSSVRIHSQFEQMASQLQVSVQRYLKGKISVLIGQWGTFPADVAVLYQRALSAFRKQIGKQSEMFAFASVPDEPDPAEDHSLRALYEPPVLIHLFEVEDWEGIREKYEAIFEELGRKSERSKDYILETFFTIYSAYTFIAHKYGLELEAIIGPSLADTIGLAACRSVTSLQRWTMDAFEKLTEYADKEAAYSRSSTVEKIRNYVLKNLGNPISLKEISGNLYLHPVYISKVYKAETGENLSDYVVRLKMERAANLLRNSALKIYEIAVELGYHNPNYFNKVFRKFYGATPQQFRQHQ